MAGLRIKHQSVINRIFTIVDGGRPYSTGFNCPLCGRVHTFKTYHIELDGEGAAIVSPEVWSRVQRIPNHGFQLTNEVEKPPARTLHVGFAHKSSVVDHLGREIYSVEPD